MTQDELCELMTFVAEQEALSMRTIMIAECVSFDDATGTVTVQPLIKMIDATTDESFTPSQLTNIPVKMFGSGNWFITHRPEKGDVCLLKVADRGIENWKQSGGLSEPKRGRHHNSNDAIADFGINDYTKALNGIKRGIDIRSRDGLTSVHVSDSEVSVTINGKPLVSVTESSAEFNVPSFKINGVEVVGHVHGGVTSGSASTAPMV